MSQDKDKDKFLDEVCGNCGCTYGSHFGGLATTYPVNYCPSGEDSNDWKNGPGTVFKPTGEYKEEEE